MSIRIMLVDDHQVIREGLRSLIEKQADLSVIAEADDGRAAVSLAGEMEPDVIVMDVAMPEMNGMEATRQIKISHPDIKILALSMYPDKGYVTEMLKAGASGYLPKNCAFGELVTAIRTIINNQVYLSPQIAGIVVDGYINKIEDEDSSSFRLLSGREREVLQLIAEGRSSREIGEMLSVSIKTADFHRQHIMKKLNIKSVAELTKYAIKEGLTTLES